VATTYWLLFYDYVDDIVERRGPFRDAHLARAREAHDRGTLLFAGAVADPVDGALFVFSADDGAVVEAFARDDPYVREGLVTAWKVRRWNVVVGGDEAP
jgi:uncharacterized protein YciI